MARSSRHLSDTARLRALPSAPTRALLPSEIAVLERNGNRTLPGADWSAVRVLVGGARGRAGGDPSAIRGSSFGGRVVLGAFPPRAAAVAVDGVSLPAGIFNSTVVDTVICDGARVSDTVLLARSVVGSGAAVVGCGAVVMTTKAQACTFANGRSLAIAVEVGGRDVSIFAEMTLEDAAHAAGDRSDKDALRARNARVLEYAQQASAAHTLVADGARILHCPRVENAFIGRSALVRASTVVDATVLSSERSPVEITGGSLVEHSIVQWGCSISSMAIVSGSFMCAASHVERHAKLLDSVLGPCSGAAEGEITSSLVGPFVGFHHQALLIACFWPAGRGNIGYGANVGSNHTGKAPDQEIWPGEGVFFGLATSIKFPSNFTRAPYTLVATGVVALPQKVEMPFSLINSPGKTWADQGGSVSISPALNEIMPGWILSDNLYMVLRGEAKFLKRGAKARNLDWGEGRVDYEHEAFRPSTVRLLVEARRRLLEAAGKGLSLQSGGDVVYTSKQVPGLGKNYMLEKARLKGIQAYSDFIRFYCVRAMWRALQAGEPARSILARRTRGVEDAALLGTFDALSSVVRTEGRSDGGLADGDGARVVEEWYAFALPLLLDDAGPAYTVDVGLREYVDLQKRFAASVLASKQKDDKRGPRVIQGYGDAHGAAERDDKVVLKAMADAEEQEHAVTRYLERAQNKL